MYKIHVTDYEITYPQFWCFTTDISSIYEMMTLSTKINNSFYLKSFKWLWRSLTDSLKVSNPWSFCFESFSKPRTEPSRLADLQSFSMSSVLIEFKDFTCIRLYQFDIFEKKTELMGLFRTFEPNFEEGSGAKVNKKGHIQKRFPNFLKFFHTVVGGE